MDIFKASVYRIYERIMKDYMQGAPAFRAEYGDARIDFDVDEELFPALEAIFNENGYRVEQVDSAHVDGWMVGMRIEPLEDYLKRQNLTTDEVQ
jgi:hypothetical protein